jgi:uncharacterized membrane protein
VAAESMTIAMVLLRSGRVAGSARAAEALIGIGDELDIGTADLAAAGVLVAFGLDKPGQGTGRAPKSTRLGWCAIGDTAPRLGGRKTDAPGAHWPLPGTNGRRRGWHRNGAERKRLTMAIGPVQLIVLGFRHPHFHGEIIAELERLRASDTVRVIDSLAVYKTAEGELEVEHLSNLSEREAIELGSKVGALIGLGFDGEQGMEAGAEAGAEQVAEQGGVHVFTEEEGWDVLEDIPNDSAAALILLEHHWAVPLRDAIARAGGFRLSDGFISPLDLVEIGLMSAEDAKELHDMETAAAAS